MYNLLIFIARAIFGYIKSYILSFVVLPTFSAIIFIFSAFINKVHATLIKYLTIFNIDLNSLSGTFNAKDVMKVFGIVSLAIFLIIELLKLAGLKIKPSLKRGLLLLSVIFGFTIFLILYPTNNLKLIGSNSIFIYIFAIFWIVTMFAYTLWYFLNKIKLQTKNDLVVK